MIRVGILGTGNIGTDLLLKVLREKKFNPVIFAGRRMESDGIKLAKLKNVHVTDEGINFFIKNKNCVDVVFDCTNSIDATEHAKIFKEQNIRVIDLTPSKVGELCVPSINSSIILDSQNVNMITCGGQAAMPILHLISNYCSKLKYVEIVSQIASKSAGLATRINVDGYIHTTEAAIKKFTKCEDCKVIINLNPAEPCVDMQTTMFLKFEDIDFEPLVEAIYAKIKELKLYIPYYELVLPPIINDDGVLVLSVKVKGSGDYLPEYAGNLDIINCAAIEITKKIL
jgi:acetaldehyde dehydrogenase (acetylating)